MITRFEQDLSLILGANYAVFQLKLKHNYKLKSWKNKNASGPHVEDKNPKDDVGMTPLHIAAEEGNFDLVTAMLQDK